MNNNILTRYEQAQTIMQGYATNRFVMNDAVFPYWITCSDGSDSYCFWYVRETKQGKEFRLVNAKAATNTRAFDHQALAASLTRVMGQVVDSKNLPISDVSITLSPLKICFQSLGKHWCYDPDSKHCQEQVSQGTQQGVYSPDGKKVVFLREHNLWIQDLTSGEAHALTEDGTENYSYGSAFLGIDTTVQALWSPDSKQLFTVQLDTRDVAARPIINYVPQDGSLRPILIQPKLAYPGDEHVPSYRLAIIDSNTGDLQAADYPHLPYVYHGAETIDGFFTGNLGWWSPDSRHAFFIDITRGSKKVNVVRWDTHTGATQVLFEESTDTYIRICEDTASPPVFLPLSDCNELIWYSERSGWAHLYLYDLNTGELKHPITEGQWLVRGILHYDAKQRELLLQTAARDPDISPYYRDICKVNIDSGVLTPLISSRFDHIVYSPKYLCLMISRAFHKIEYGDDVYGTSPCGQYVVTTYSRVDTPPVTVLINREGNEILTVETADISGLPIDWHWPEPVKLKAADDQTDIYGVVFRPPGFSPDKRYPVVDFLSGQRIANLAPQGSFINSHFCNYHDMAALAALGFIVVGIVGRGTPYRNKTFQDHNFGKPGYDDDLNDHITGLRQLATRYPYMDLEHLGITSMESAPNVVYGSLNHSDFYKVTVSHAFTDPRDTLSLLEMYHGLHDKETLSRLGGPEDCAESFSGKLLLINGPGSEATFRLAEALQKANKDFDMLCLPNLVAEVTSYTRRRGWDYLVTHLQGIEPPHQFQLTTGMDIIIENAGGLGSGWYTPD